MGSHPASQEDHATSEVNRMLAHTLGNPYNLSVIKAL